MTELAYIHIAGAIGVLLIAFLFSKFVVTKHIDKNWTAYYTKSKVATIFWVLMYGLCWFLYGCSVEMLLFTVMALVG